MTLSPFHQARLDCMQVVSPKERVSRKTAAEDCILIVELLGMPRDVAQTHASRQKRGFAAHLETVQRALQPLPALFKSREEK